MAVSEAARLALYEKMKEQVGRQEATTLMDLLRPMDWNEIATTRDVLVTRQEVTNLGAGLRTEMVDLRSGLRTEMADLRTELHTEMAHLTTAIRGEMADLRNDMIDRFAAADRRHTTMLVGFALTMWMGFAATILTVVYAG